MWLASRQGTKGTRSLPSILTLMKEHGDWDAKILAPQLIGSSNMAFAYSGGDELLS